MREDSPYWLHFVNVVVTAEFHNPSILNPAFLVSQKIVPPEWIVTESITTPPVSIVRYSEGKGIHWVVDQSTLAVTEVCESPFQNHYVVYELVKAYLDNLPHVSYRSLGLNWTVSMECTDPENWITERFLKPGSWIGSESKLLGMLPKFTLDADGATCGLVLRTGNVKRNVGEDKKAVTVDCNVHHEGPLDVDGLRDAIERWRERQDFVMVTLDKLLRLPQT